MCQELSTVYLWKPPSILSLIPPLEIWIKELKTNSFISLLLYSFEYLMKKFNMDGSGNFCPEPIPPFTLSAYLNAFLAKSI